MGAKITTLEEARNKFTLKIGQLIATKKKEREGLTLKEIFLHFKEGLASYFESLISFDEEKEFKDDYYFDVIKGLLLDIVEDHLFYVFRGPAFQKTEETETGVSGEIIKIQCIKENYENAASNAINKVVLPSFFDGTEALREKCDFIFFDDGPVVTEGIRSFINKALQDKKIKESTIAAGVLVLLALTEELINNLNSATTEDDCCDALLFYQYSCARALYAVVDTYLEHTSATPENEKNNIYKLATCFILAEIFIFNVKGLPDTPRELAQILDVRVLRGSDKEFDVNIPKVEAATYAESLFFVLNNAIERVKRVRRAFGKEETYH